MAFIVIREGKVDPGGLKKMALDYTAMAKKAGVQVAIGTEHRYAKSKRLVAITKSTREMEIA